MAREKGWGGPGEQGGASVSSKEKIMRETVQGASNQIEFPSRNHAQNAKHPAISKNAAARNIAREGSAAKLIGSYPSGKLARVRLANATSDSMTGTSTSTPTTVASAAPLVSPNRPMAKIGRAHV